MTNDSPIIQWCTGPLGKRQGQAYEVVMWDGILKEAFKNFLVGPGGVICMGSCLMILFPMLFLLYPRKSTAQSRPLLFLLIIFGSIFAGLFVIKLLLFDLQLGR